MTDRAPGPGASAAGTGVLSVGGASMDGVAVIRGTGPFVGRRAELERLARLVAQAGEGTAGAVLVSGDAGVGKTRLVAEAVHRTAGGGVLVAVGRCVDLGAGGLPYLPFTEAFTGLLADPVAGEAVRAVAAERPTLRRLAGRGDVSAGPDDAQQRLALFDAVAASLRAVAERGPLVLVLEDLHWADASTRDLVRFLLARLSDERLAVVATYRSDDLHRRHPLRALLAELVRLPAVERLDVRPFDPAELRDYLVRLHGGDVTERVVRDIARRSEGNAFYAAELLQALDDGPAPGGGGPVRALGSGPAAGFGGLPDALVDVLLARVERLPEAAQRIARVAAVGGRRVGDRLLRSAYALVEAAGVAADRAADDALREVVAHQVLVEDELGGFTFRHALLQEAVYADLLPGERARLHGVYARLLAADPSAATAVDLARHAVEAHDLAAALAAWLVAAREAERRLAPGEALAHYEQALRLWSSVPAADRPPGADLPTLGMDAAHTAVTAGEVRRAVALAEAAVREAAGHGDPREEARLRNRYAGVLYVAERYDEAMAQVRAVSRLVSGEGPSPERVWAATVEARIRGGAGDVWEARREHLVRGGELVESALDDARALGMAAAEADLLISLAETDGVVEGAEAARRRLEEALARGREAGAADVVQRASFKLALNRLDVGDLPLAEQALVEMLQESERAGLASTAYGAEARSVLAQVLVVRGGWDRALRTVGDERPRLPARETLFLTVPVLPVHAARDPQQALDRARALLDCDPDYPIYWHVVLVPRAEALLWLRRPGEAAAAVEATLDSFRALGTPLIMGGVVAAAVGIAAQADLAAEASVTGRPDDLALARSRAAALLDHARRVTLHGPTRLKELGPEGRAWLCRAEAEITRLGTGAGGRGGAPGPGDVDAWRAAHEAFGYGHVHESARTAWRLAAALLARGAAGDRDEAAALARSARETAVRLRARPFREAVDALAVRHRLDLGEGRPADVVLTPRESEVMRLVAEGLTNREIGERLFISQKTASVHVSNLMAKLGASGRTEAVTIALRRGLLDVGSTP